MPEFLGRRVVGELAEDRARSRGCRVGPLEPSPRCQALGLPSVADLRPSRWSGEGRHRDRVMSCVLGNGGRAESFPCTCFFSIAFSSKIILMPSGMFLSGMSCYLAEAKGFSG